MLGTVLYSPGDIRCEEVAEPEILQPTDAILKLAATCICGSDLWPYRGLQPLNGPMHMGHEYCGVVVEVGSAVTTVKPGQFVVGSFCCSDNTCPHCRFGFPSSCENREFMTRAQAPLLRSLMRFGNYEPGSVGQALGGVVRLDDRAGPGSAGEYAWGGAAGTGFWATPGLGLSVTMMTQLMPVTAMPARDMLRPMVYQALASGG